MASGLRIRIPSHDADEMLSTGRRVRSTRVAYRRLAQLVFELFRFPPTAMPTFKGEKVLCDFFAFPEEQRRSRRGDYELKRMWAGISEQVARRSSRRSAESGAPLRWRPGPWGPTGPPRGGRSDRAGRFSRRQARLSLRSACVSETFNLSVSEKFNLAGWKAMSPARRFIAIDPGVRSWRRLAS